MADEFRNLNGNVSLTDLIISFQKSANNVRIGVIHNPVSIDGDMFIPRAIQAALNTQQPAMARSFVTKLAKEENVAALASKEKILADLAVNVSREFSHLSSVAESDR